jgi:hypothetical protein
MTRTTTPPKPTAAPHWHQVFLTMLPAIKTHARISFQHLRGEAHEEAVQNAVCLACAAVARLADLDKLDLCYPTVLARYAVAQSKDGRMLGRPLNCKDVASEFCQRVKGVVMERLDRYDDEEQAWKEILIPDKTCTPADLAATRIDFAAWLRSLSRRHRRIARFLSLGHPTRDAARTFGVSDGRISQIRKELAASWRSFLGDTSVPAAA